MSQVLELAQINLHGTATTPAEAIDEAGRLLVASGAVTPDYIAFMHDREATVSTYMGNYLAIPHGTNEGKDTILSSALSFVRYDQPIDWNGKPAEFVIGIAGAGDDHLALLSRIAETFTNAEAVDRLRAASTPEDVLAVLDVVRV